MNVPGPIKQAISNAKARKEEKQRAAEQGYEYNRNIIHDVGQDKSRNIKGSVGAAAQAKLNQAKKDVKKVSSAVKESVQSKVKQIQKSREARKAMQAGESRGRKSSDDMGTARQKKSNEIIQKGKKGFTTGGTKKASSQNRSVKKQSKRSMGNRVS